MDTAALVSEIQRQVANLVRFGKIADTDYPKGLVRVTSGDLLTGWLPWVTPRAGKDRVWWPPEPGEQVVLLSPSGDPAQAVVLAGLYQDAHAQNGTEPGIHRHTYQDGAHLEYNRNAHHLKASLPNGGTVEVAAPGGVVVNTQSKATISATQGLEITAPGGVQITGDVIIDGDCIANGVSLPRHVHGGVDSGNSVTNPPESG